jgi:hypothetical protein
MTKSKIFFCTFSDSRLQPTLKRISNEAKACGFFDEIFVFNEFLLNKDFKNKFKNVLRYNSRGYGYWIWKVSIIKDVLSKMRENDILLYTDSGCSFNRNGSSKFKDYLELVNKSELGILAVSLQENFLERKYSKGDLFDYFGVRDDISICDTPQIQAGVILIRKNKYSEIFFELLQNVYETDINFVNDEPSNKPNFPDFITHRHDQSVFSILFKIHKGVTVSLDEVWVENVDDIDLLEDYPIWYMRKKNRKILGLLYLFINWVNYTVRLKR